MPNVTLTQLKQELHKMDPDLLEDDEAFQAAIILLAGLSQPHTIKALQTFTGYRQSFVARAVGNLKRNDVFTRDGRIAASWFEEDGALSFWLDVNIALGFIQRARQRVA